MPAIRLGGMASGLPPNLVDQIIEAERMPIKTQEVHKNKEEAKLKLVEDLETKISDIQKNVGELIGTKGVLVNKLMSSDPTIVTGTADPENPMTGSWNIEVMQLPQKPSAVTNGFPDRNKTQVGVGYIKFKTPEGTKEVYINGKNNTLDGVVSTINTSNTGLHATVINDRTDKENPFRLLISGLSTGDEKQVSFPTVYLLDGDQDLFFDQSRPAQNGKIKVDGFEFEVAENINNEILPGVTLELNQAAPGKEVRISVKEDMELITGKIEEFVKSTNNVLQFIQAQNSLNEKTDTTKTLGGDSLLRSVENRIRNLIQTPLMGINGRINRMSQLGINFQRNGTLQFDKKKFNSELAANPKDVGAFLAGDGFRVGFVPTLKREISNFLHQTYGPITNRKRGINEKITRINKNIESKEKNLSRREETLRRQFSQLEQTMSKLQSQGSAVANIGAGLQAQKG